MKLVDRGLMRREAASQLDQGSAAPDPRASATDLGLESAWLLRLRLADAAIVVVQHGHIAQRLAIEKIFRPRAPRPGTWPGPSRAARVTGASRNPLRDPACAPARCARDLQ